MPWPWIPTLTPCVHNQSIPSTEQSTKPWVLSMLTPSDDGWEGSKMLPRYQGKPFQRAIFFSWKLKAFRHFAFCIASFFFMFFFLSLPSCFLRSLKDGFFVICLLSQVKKASEKWPSLNLSSERFSTQQQQWAFRYNKGLHSHAVIHPGASHCTYNTIKTPYPAAVTDWLCPLQVRSWKLNSSRWQWWEVGTR